MAAGDIPDEGTPEWLVYVYRRLAYEPSEKIARALIGTLGADEAKSAEMLEDWRMIRKREGWQVT